MELELTLKRNKSGGAFFYISNYFLKNNHVEIGKKYKVIIDEVE